MRSQDKEIEIPITTLSSSSSKLNSPTLIFNDPPQTSHHNHHLYPSLQPNQLHQSQRPSTDPDLSSSPVATAPTSLTTNTPTASNPQIRTSPTAAAAATISTTSTTPLIRYRECLKNHAASMGSHVVDGCGEFMPSGEEGTPESFKCAACECHRNFHRKEVEGEPPPQHHAYNYYPNKNHNNGHHNRIASSPHLLQISTPPPSSLHHHQHQHHRFSHGFATPTPSLVPPVMMAFGGAAESSSEDLNMFQSNTGGGQLSLVQQPSLSSKKRFRTKFTQQQKDGMMEFAEKLGWKIQKHDEQEVQQFCSQLGVKKQVFKVWMHNNKQAMKKQQQM